MNTLKLATLGWPDGDVESVPECPICQSTSRLTLYTDLIDDTFFSAAGKWCLKRCSDCDSGYLDPRPTPESINKAYRDYYTHHEPSSRRPDRNLKAAAKRVLQFFSDGYVATLTRSVGDASIAQKLGAAFIKSVPPCREIIDARYRHLVRPKPGRDRLLDLGCGGGDFLLRAKSLGWKIEGVDFDPKAVAAARSMGIEAHVGSIDSYADKANFFDVVTCNHVIEHLYEPCRMLSDVYRILKPGGRLWIETPNISSAGHALFGKAWRGLEAPRHLLLFDSLALVKAVTNAGFRITHRTPWNFQHIRQIFASSEEISLNGNPQEPRVRLIPNLRLLRGLWMEAKFAECREFVCLRAIKI